MCNMIRILCFFKKKKAFVYSTTFNFFNMHIKYMVVVYYWSWLCTSTCLRVCSCTRSRSRLSYGELVIVFCVVVPLVVQPHTHILCVLAIVMRLTVGELCDPLGLFSLYWFCKYIHCCCICRYSRHARPCW